MTDLMLYMKLLYRYHNVENKFLKKNANNK